MPDRVDILIDSAADLQRQINQLNDELVRLAVSILGLAIGFALMSWYLWHQ
jgi:hypothetical protein